MKQINRYMFFTVCCLLWGATVILSSCHEEITGQAESAEPCLRISAADIHTRATEQGKPSESWVSNLEILYFVDGTCIAKQEIPGVRTAFPHKQPIPVEIKNNYSDRAIDIYVAASQTTGINVGNGQDALMEFMAAPSVASAAELYYPTEHTATAAKPVIMSASLKGHDFSVEPQANLILKRRVAKLRIKIENPLPSVGSYDETKLGIEIQNVPEKTALFAPDAPVETTGNRVNYPWAGITHAAGAVTVPMVPETTEGGGLWTHHTYLNLNYQTAYANDNSVTVRLSLPYKWAGEADFTDCFYTVALSREIEANHIYQLTIKVYGIGLSGTTRNAETGRGSQPVISTEWEVLPW